MQSKYINIMYMQIISSKIVFYFTFSGNYFLFVLILDEYLTKKLKIMGSNHEIRN